MRDRLTADSNDPLMDDFAQVMLGYALLAAFRQPIHTRWAGGEKIIHL